MKRPSFQFYPGDWLRATDLRACSVGARGLWIEMICLMHEGSPYGHLKVGGKVILPANLARMVGATLSEVEGWLSELQEAGVYSIDEKGCIFSRRMIKDELIRESRASGGKLGGNPSLKDNSKVRDKVNLHANLQPTPSSASASASAIDSVDKSTSSPLPPTSQADPSTTTVEEKESEINADLSSAQITPYHQLEIHPRFNEVREYIVHRLPLLGKQNATEINRWLHDGADPERDIYPSIDHCIEFKRGDIRSFSYFTNSITTCIELRKERDEQDKRMREKYAKPS